MMEKKFVLTLAYEEKELEEIAVIQELSLQELTDTKLAEIWFEALNEEFEGIVSVEPLDKA